MLAFVAFKKWQWCDWTSIHLAGNLHMTGQGAWPSNWLLQADTLWLPTTPNLHPYVITCDTGVKLSKMAGNSSSCPLQSWSIERYCMTIWISGERYISKSLLS